MPPSLEKKRRTTLHNASQKQKRLRKIQIGLGLFACVVLITVLAWPYLKEEGMFLSAKKASQIGLLGKDFDFKKKQLVNPRFEGEDDKERPYVLEARLATQKGEGEVDLVEPKGTLNATDEEQVTLVAEKGNLTQDNTHLFLEGNVVLQGQGCVTTTDQAEADFKTKQAQGDQQVTSKCKEGTITGVGFAIDQNQGTILYKGRPHMVLHSTKQQAENSNEKK